MLEPLKTPLKLLRLGLNKNPIVFKSLFLPRVAEFIYIEEDNKSLLLEL